MNLAVCIGPSILSSSTKISVDRREEVSKSVPKVIRYLIDNWPTLFDPMTTSDIMSSCPTRASTSSLNLDSATPASQSSSYEGNSPSNSGSSSLTSTPSPIISTVITLTPTTTTTLPPSSTPISPPSYQETIAKMAQMAHHYQQQKQRLFLQHQQLNQSSQGLQQQQPLQTLPVTSPCSPTIVQPVIVQRCKVVPQTPFCRKCHHQMQQVYQQQQQQQMMQSHPVAHSVLHHFNREYSGVSNRIPTWRISSTFDI